MRKQNLILQNLLQETKITNNMLTRRDRMNTSEIQDLLHERDQRIKHRRNLQALHKEYKRLTDARLQSYIQERTSLLESNHNLTKEWRELDRQLSRVESRQKNLTWNGREYISLSDLAKE